MVIYLWGGGSEMALMQYSKYGEKGIKLIKEIKDKVSSRRLFSNFKILTVTSLG
jgi:hypothetical protein